MLRNIISSALIAAAACALTGCYSVPPYGAYPNMYAPGVPTYRQMPPRAGYVMPGEILQAPPATITAAPPAAAPSGLQTAPPANPRPATPSASEKPVPEPRDPAANGGKRPDRSTSMLDEPFEPTVAERAFEFESNNDSEFQRPRLASATRTSREPTIARSSRDTESEITQVGFQNVATHHPEFQWIQGFLQFNPRMQSWHLMYDASPGEDANGGEVKLTGTLPFTKADHNKPFRVWGRFHNALLDELKKPQYVVDRVERISPAMLESQ